MLRPRAADVQGDIVSVPEEAGMLATELEDPRGDEQFESRVARFLGKPLGPGSKVAHGRVPLPLKMRSSWGNIRSGEWSFARHPP